MAMSAKMRLLFGEYRLLPCGSFQSYFSNVVKCIAKLLLLKIIGNISKRWANILEKIFVLTDINTINYKQQPLRKVKMAVCNHQVDSTFYLWYDVCFGNLQAKKKSMVMHDTEWPY